VRGAVVAVHGEASGLGDTTQPCDATVFVGRYKPAESMAARLLSQRKHVLLAAESCLSDHELRSLSNTARQHGVQLAVLNPDRCLPSRQLIRQQLDAGKLGDVGLVRIHCWRSPAAADTGRAAEPLDALARCLDLAAWFVGRSADRVFAVAQAADVATLGGSRFVQVHLGFSGGGMALIDCTDRLPNGDGYDSLSVIGSAGAAYADDHQNMQLVFRGDRPQAVRADEGPQQLAAIVQQFVDAIAAGRDLSPSVAAWQDVLGVVGSVLQSIDSRQAIAREGR
jgi:predicted dehydrogenase